MKQLLIILLAFAVSCSNQQSEEKKESEDGHEHAHTVATAPLNNGTKWKADEATKKNVAALVQIINDSTYSDVANRMQLYTHTKEKVDTLVKQCSMKGAEHDALHVWLEKVLKDLKEVKEDDEHYRETRAELKKDIEDFYNSFE